MGFDLPVLNRLRRFGSGVIPASLFANAEPGVWYDPSDITTLFQDNFGVTPVTAPAQTVGLILDKSRGLALGPELVVNGSFATDTNWTKGTGWTISGGSANSIQPNNLQSLTQVRAFPAGTYRVQFTVSNYVAGLLAARFSGGGSDSSPSVSANGAYTFLVTTTGPRTQFDILTVGGSGATASVDDISVRLLPGNHATQATLAQRPTYQVDGTGLSYLSFDGVDDGMVTRTITPGTDKAQVFAGVRKLSDSAIGMIAELGNAINYQFQLYSNSGANFVSVSRGSVSVAAVSASSFASPVNVLLSGLGDIGGDVSAIRTNGTQVTNSTDQGTLGNYATAPIYIGRRGGTTLPFNGRIYSLIVRFGANLTAEQIGAAEAWSNSKTGAY